MTSESLQDLDRNWYYHLQDLLKLLNIGEKKDLWGCSPTTTSKILVELEIVSLIDYIFPEVKWLT